MDEELEEALPPLVRHAELLQKYGLLMSEAEEAEEKLVFGFILKQLLLIAQVQDFGDEMGRRDMLVGLRKGMLIRHLTASFSRHVTYSRGYAQLYRSVEGKYPHRSPHS